MRYSHLEALFELDDRTREPTPPGTHRRLGQVRQEIPSHNGPSLWLVAELALSRCAHFGNVVNMNTRKGWTFEEASMRALL
jgi:hypothetical protein